MGHFAARKKKAYSADSACKPVYLFLRLLFSVIKCFEGTGEVLLTAFDSAACIGAAFSLVFDLCSLAISSCRRS